MGEVGGVVTVVIVVIVVIVVCGVLVAGTHVGVGIFVFIDSPLIHVSCRHSPVL